MSTFKQFGHKRHLTSTPATPTSSFMRPSRPFTSVPSPSTQSVPPESASLETRPRIGFDFAHIPLFPDPATIAPAQTVPSASVGQQLLMRALGARPSADAAASVPDEQLASCIQAARTRGHPLEEQAQQTLERGLGTDLSGVRVHTDREADQLSHSVDAVAFTTGTHIFFRSGMYRPDSLQGMHLLAHEAAHTVQQMAGPVEGKPRTGGLAINDPGDRFEQAAEAAAVRVTARNWLSVGQRNGHHGLPAVHREGVPRTAPSTSSDYSVVQRLISASQFSNAVQYLYLDRHLQEIHRLIERYNRFRDALTGRHRQRLLLQLSQQVQVWLVNNIRSYNRDAVLNLLDNIQADYRVEIGRVIQNRANFYASDNLAQNEQDDVHDLWNHLRGDTGNLRIDDVDRADRTRRRVIANFRQNMLAALGELLQTPSGRKLLRKLIFGPLRVTIVPLTREAKQLIAQTRQALSGKADDEVAHSPAITMADIRNAADLDQARQLLGQAYQNIGPTGDPRTEFTQGSTRGLIPVGTNAIVAIDPSVNDSSLFALSTSGNPLITPLFLTLQHELNHAKRITRGRARARVPFIEQPSFPSPNLEEVFAIAASRSSENVERQARGLGQRRGHQGGLRSQLLPPNPAPLLALPAPTPLLALPAPMLALMPPEPSEEEEKEE